MSSSETVKILRLFIFTTPVAIANSWSQAERFIECSDQQGKPSDLRVSGGASLKRVYNTVTDRVNLSR
ncbi:hypothetical protein Mapa_001239 [Marchantia paleacea]|nr:hypothetical protein Mapa_001239 [Marchantia paleacea]